MSASAGGDNSKNLKVDIQQVAPTIFFRESPQSAKAEQLPNQGSRRRSAFRSVPSRSGRMIIPGEVTVTATCS